MVENNGDGLKISVFVIFCSIFFSFCMMTTLDIFWSILILEYGLYKCFHLQSENIYFESICSEWCVFKRVRIPSTVIIFYTHR